MSSRKLAALTFLYLGIASIPFDVVTLVGPVRVTLTEGFFLLALGFWSPSLLSSREPLQFSPFMLPMGIFLVACLPGLAFAENKVVVAREIVQFGWLFAVFFMIYHLARDGRVTEMSRRILLLVAAVVSVVGITQYVLGLGPVDFLVAETRSRAYGFYDQPNPFGSFLIGVIPLLFGVYFMHAASLHGGVPTFVAQLQSRKPVILGLLVVTTGALVATFSRGSWFGLGVGMVFFFTLLWKRIPLRQVAAPLAMVILTIGIVTVDVVGQPALLERSFSNRMRWLLGETALGLIQDHPLAGVGLGNFETLLPRVASPELMAMMQRDFDEKNQSWSVNPGKQVDVELVHNMVLQVGVEAGLIGLAAFVWFLTVFFREAIRRLRAIAVHDEYVSRLAMLSGVVAIFAAGMLGWPFSHGVQELLIVQMAFSVAPHY